VCVVSCLFAGLQGKGDGNGKELCYLGAGYGLRFCFGFWFSGLHFVFLERGLPWVLCLRGIVKWWKCNYDGT